MTKDQEQKQAHLATIVQKAARYENLESNEEFQLWKVEQLDTRIDACLKALTDANMATDEGRQAAWASTVTLQALHDLDRSFSTWKSIGERARERMKKLTNKGVA